MTLPCLYPLCSLIYPLSYPLRKQEPMLWVIPLFLFPFVATNSNEYSGSKGNYWQGKPLALFLKGFLPIGTILLCYICEGVDF